MPPTLHELEEKPRRAIVVAVQLPDVGDQEFESSLEELRALAKTLGVTVVGQVTQKRSSFDPGAYLGSGKREELRQVIGATRPEDKPFRKPDKKRLRDEEWEQRADKRQVPDPASVRSVESGVPREYHDEDEQAVAEEEGGEKPEAERLADTILVDHEISPSQARNLEKETGCEVFDRTMVILDIFHRHARSRAARAQVEMVRLQYLAPRLRETGGGKDRQRGGIGGKGAGESALELDRRKIRDRIAELGEELQALEEERRTQRQRRSASGVARVALVGYTNAGKSTLMRSLTGSEVYVADKLFATLDTTVRTLAPESVPRILVSDTVGFIKNLPHDLVASFKSTLDEALEASLLAHIVDASDPGFERQLAVTEEVLDEIGAHEVPRLLVFNKIDRVGDEEAQAARQAELRAKHPDAVVMSARRPADVARLRQTFIDFFSRDLVEDELRVGWDRQAMRGEIHANCQVIEERYDEAGAILHVRAQPEVLTKLKQSLA